MRPDLKTPDVGQASPLFRQGNYVWSFFHHCEHFLACQVCTMRTWLCGMVFFFWHKNLFSNTSNQNLHPQQNINGERCFRGAYLCSKWQEQPAPSKDSVLSGEDFSSRNSTSVTTPQNKLGGFRSSSLIPWRIRFIWPTFGIPRSRLWTCFLFLSLFLFKLWHYAKDCAFVVSFGAIHRRLLILIGV